MPSIIDWISISLPISSLINQSGAGGEFSLSSVFHQEYPILTDHIERYPDVTLGKGRRPFTRSFHSALGGFTAFYSPTLPYSLIEFTGEGCRQLRRSEQLSNIIRDFRDNITRIDIATDIETNTRPTDFALMRDSKRFKSFGVEKSESGETYYVGSKTSDRFARVYRYEPPHPRAHLLRVEVVLRDDNAKMIARELGRSSLSSIVSSLGNTFGWSHPVWNEKRNDAPMRAAPRDVGQGKTERWLFTSVIPAIERLLAEGSDKVVAEFGYQVYALFNAHQQEKEHINV